MMMAAPSLAMNLPLKPSPIAASQPSYVVIEPVTWTPSTTTSSPSSSSSNGGGSGSGLSVNLPPPPTSGSGGGSVTVVQPGGSGGGGGGGGGKDSGWLTLEVCREHIRQRCTRSESDCRFAHPPPHVDIQNGRVVCCFDSIKGRCQRNEPPCKYLHPPQHLKEQLLQNGRNNLIMKNLQQIQRIQHNSAAASMLPTAGTTFYPMVNPLQVNPYVVVNPSSWYPSYYNAGSMPPSSGHNGCVSMASAVATPTPTVAPVIDQPELESCVTPAMDGSYSTVQTVSQAGGTQYWTLAPNGSAGGNCGGGAAAGGGVYAANALSSAYYSPSTAVYYPNGNYTAMPTATMIVPKRTVATGNGGGSGAVDGSGGKNGYHHQHYGVGGGGGGQTAATAVYPCGAAAYHQQMGPVDMSSCYAMAITVPPPVNAFYGC